LRRAADLLDEQPRLAIICARVLVGPEGREDPICMELARSPFPRRPGMPGPPLLGFLAGASVVRRSAYLEAGGFEPRFFIGGEEELLAADLVARGDWICYVPELVVPHHPSHHRDGRAPLGGGPQRAVVRLDAAASARRPREDAAPGVASALGRGLDARPRRGVARVALGLEAATRRAPRGRAGAPPAGGAPLMFFDHDVVADRLPPGTLCLTFDDGPGRTEGDDDRPGPRTAELGAFLHASGVPATFFAVGEFARQSGDILAVLRTLGHLVANHTFDHPSLPALVARGGDAADQVARTDVAIRDHVEGTTFFREPYGDWRLRGEARSNGAAALNRSRVSTGHVGPIGWDIDAGDVGFWRDGRPAEDCARAYLDAIETAGRGIVLMHDSTADIAEIRPRNWALGVVRRLVPELRRRGYRFVRLDAIPQVASAARGSTATTLVARDDPGRSRRPIRVLRADRIGGVSGREARPRGGGHLGHRRPGRGSLGVARRQRPVSVAPPRGRGRLRRRTSRTA
jgi:peptidoglycan/xylan/chitin deacetylase (PgdA/CDA1 family)